LFDTAGLRLSSAVIVNAPEYPFLLLMEKECRKLESLVRNQIRKNVRILFPFIDNVLEENIHNAEVLYALEFEMHEIHDRHMEMRTCLANLSGWSHGFHTGPDCSESMKVVFSELHSLEQHLYRLFYLEDVLLFPQIIHVAFGEFKYV
jgi:iron-sulfur cluster repair protein YtfE (RIC family)